MPKRSTPFMSRIGTAARERAAREAAKLSARERAQLEREERQRKLAHLAARILDNAYGRCLAAAEALGGNARAGRGGERVELMGGPVPILFEVQAGERGVAIGVQWADHEFTAVHTTLAAATAWIEGQLEAAVRGVPPVTARRKPRDA